MTAIKRTSEFDVQNAHWLAKCAELAYEDQATIHHQVEKWEEEFQFGFRQFHYFDHADTQAFMLCSKQAIILSFRGTEPDNLEDWKTDLKVKKVGGPLNRGKVHRGFLNALLSVWEPYRTRNENGEIVWVEGIDAKIRNCRQQFADENGGNKPPIWITGHSLGAALATLATAFLIEENIPVWALYTFGSPRVGDNDFKDVFDANFSRHFRLYNNNDIVARVPTRSMGYAHVGKPIYLSENRAIDIDPSSWFVFVDRAWGSFAGLGDGKIELDSIADHAMAEYIETLKQNLPG